MDQFLEILKHHFVWGLLLGLLLAFFAWKSGLSNKLRLSRDVRRLENELRELQGHLNTQLKINSQGNQTLQDELDELRQQNENLRVSLAGLQTKPGRAEARQYQVTENAVRLMREQAPGFAPAWEKAVRQAELEVEAGESGLKKLVRKVMPGIGMGSGSGSSHTEESEEA
ncbi:hypothetical protein [Haloferula sp.]|uniref:hypothetical protein n=1 Tax=Haloferula sp. TaxID=2497595 RepID=UPI00329F8E63